MVFLFRLLSRLPLALLHRLGAGLGRLVYVLSPTYRRHLCENLVQAGLPLTLRGPVAAETGKQMLELARIWMRPLEEAVPLVTEVVGWELVEAARAAGGVVFLTPHLGCFEITAQYLSSFGDITVLYRAPKKAVAQELILMGRKRAQLHLAPADLSGVRALIKALKKGEMVGMLPDQAPKTGEGAWLKFFGRYAYTMTLAARLTETTGVTSLLTWGERLSGGRGYRIHFQQPSVPLSGSTVERAQQINWEIEKLIRQRPAQYLWGYNRYKRPAGAEAPPAESA